MGAGASPRAGVGAALATTSEDELRSLVLSLSAADRAKLTGAVNSAGEFTLFYHSACAMFLGRGWAPYMILEQSGVKYTIKPPEEKPTGCFAVPCVQTPSGAVVGQTSTVVTCIGKETGLWPKDTVGDAKAMQLCVDATDLFSETSSDKPMDRIEKWYAHFESILATSSGSFFFGSAITAADFHVYTAIDRSFYKNREAGPEALKKYEKLNFFKAKVEETKGYTAVMAKCPGGDDYADPWVWKYWK
jgi:hypothetical protein